MRFQLSGHFHSVEFDEIICIIIANERISDSKSESALFTLSNAQNLMNDYDVKAWAYQSIYVNRLLDAMKLKYNGFMNLSQM